MTSGEPLPGDWLSTAEAAALLGVKPQTLYAYVSRGQLARRQGQSGHASLFHRRDVERLAERTTRRGRQGRVDALIDTDITLLETAGRLFYRGEDVTGLTRTRTFEEVAEWLWSGTWHPVPSWAPPAPQLAAATSARTLLDPGVRPATRLNVALPLVAAADPDRGDLGERDVAATARRLLGALVRSLPALGPPATWPEPEPDEEPEPVGVRRAYAAGLWPRLCSRPASAPEIALLDAALILLADHELAASTLAVRIAASVRADPYLAVGAGLSTLGGTLHGGASLVVEDMLRALPDPATAVDVIAARLARNEQIPGFGHAVYTDRDPRADCLLAAAGATYRAGKAAAVLDVAAAVVRAVERNGGPAPNIDLAVGAFAAAGGLTRSAGEAIFALARCAGWMAHAMEEYRRRSRFRMRAVYTGPQPTPPAVGTG